MKKRLLAIATALSLLSGLAYSAEIEKHVSVGYQRGFATRVGLSFWDFAEGLPLGAEFSFGYVNMTPGNAFDARSVFINDNRNGTPERSSKMWDFRLDLIYPIEIRGVKLDAVGGLRYGLYTASFHFVGANEAFDVTSNQWGMGFGLKKEFPINERFALLVQAGFDYYFDSALEGHDTTYYPDNQNVNSRRDYDFNDASKAANQPGFIPVLMAGVSF